MDKNNEVMNEWFREMKGKTYIRVDDSFKRLRYISASRPVRNDRNPA